MDYKVADVAVAKELRKNRREAHAGYQRLLNEKKQAEGKGEKQDA